jgi:SAM-dependent methyltransferase
MTTLDATRDLDERASFDLFAAHYDAFTDHPGHSDWFRRLEALARRHGLSGRRALDIGCGTGKSTLALIELGYEVVGCEPCKPMLDTAARKLGGRATLVHASAEGLPYLGQFDYIACVNDVCNYILDPERLGAAFRAMAANLADDGVLLFDANTPVIYFESFAPARVSESPAGKLVWHGANLDHFTGDGIVETTIDFFEPEGDLWRHRSVRHAQRHYDDETVARLLQDAGLRVLAVYGQTDGGPPEQPVEHDRHVKSLYLVAKC